MQIKKISVTGLFGAFNHLIDLNTKEGITIIHGPNGFGKTTTLKLLDGLFSSRYSVIQGIPFDKFTVNFSNGDSIEVLQKASISKDKENSVDLILRYLRINHEVQETFLNSKKTIKGMSLLTNAIDNIPELQGFSSRAWIYMLTGEKLSAEEVIERFEDRLPPGIRNKFFGDEDWLIDLKQQVKVRLIESQRLLNTVSNRSSRRYAGESSRRYSEEVIMIPTVSIYSEELANTIKRKLEEYGNTSQLIDRTFPIRVIQHGIAGKFTDKELQEQLTDLERSRSRLIEVGLLDNDDNSDFQIPSQKFDESTRNLLSVYISDMRKKISVFDDIIEKMDLFRKLVNQKFLYSQKEMDFDKDKGFVFKMFDNLEPEKFKILSPTDLSSGEQHEVVLLYELLFKVQRGSLVLIDEPELSLHISWQKQFLKDLHEITKLTQINILMATHSPDIIQDRWDLTVQLKGPQK